ncbi:CaiB/BaiF CoA transferase family protein [Pueribacillus sp. YX66]|uniref:CaiB/BaiF CoA transferase family protein n=1 Tax=Pueribacillus sp. YX66 TaxID=3229242 RepID=UPI00358D07E3
MTLPLKNIRVLDLTRLLPGPYCSQFFADFGAEVIKIEEPKVGDYARWTEPRVDGYSAMFASLNRNKKSVTLNLKLDDDRKQFRELVKTADVLIESFRPGVMNRLGLGYEDLKELNPKLVYCAITGFGQTGPYKDKPGHDINYLSYAGLLHFNVGAQGEKPTVPATQIADLGGGALMGVAGILTALMGRNVTGKGQFVDISMMDGVVSWMQTVLPEYLAGKPVTEGELTLAGGRACYGVYETADGRYLSVGALEPKFWRTFCEGIERPDLISLLDAPQETQVELRKTIQQEIGQKTLAEWNVIFEKIDACVSPVLTLDEMIEDPQVKARDMLVTYEGQRQIANPIKLSETPAKIYSKAPLLGEHNDKILKKNTDV